MRRSIYQERAQKSYIKMPSKEKQIPTQLNTQAFKLHLNRIPEDNFIVPKERIAVYQPRNIRPMFHRPFTTQKANSFSEIKRQNNELLLKKSDHQRQLFINTYKNQQLSSSLMEPARGKLYRGSSWANNQKYHRDLSPGLTRYQIKSRNQSGLDLFETRRTKRNSGINDILGQQLKPPEHLVAKQEDFFEYVMRFSYRTKKGYIPSNSGKVNQDNFVIHPNINNKTWQHFFAVCDGHGPLGHHVSAFIKNNLSNSVSNVKNIQKYPKEGLTKAFGTTYDKLLRESNVDMSFSGSTVIGVYLNQNKLYCANVGDSRAILGKCLNNQWRTVQLSIDHKPSLPKEAERIKKMKGRIEPFKDENGQFIGPLRVWVQNDSVPGLAMTRSFGDLVGASVGVSPVPQIQQFNLCQDDRIILIGSDGVFEFLQNQQIIKSLIPYYQNKQIQQASDNLLNMANRSWTKNSSIVDDITFILIFINYNEI